MVKNLLVIECDPTHNWYEIFHGATVGGEEVVVEQTEIMNIALTTYENGRAVCELRGTTRPVQKPNRMFQPDFLLFRSVTRAIHGQDSRNVLFGLMAAGLPSVNSLHSVYMCLERVVVSAELRKIQKRLPKGEFPLIKQIYYPDHRQMLITPDYPIVVKMGHAHAGYGKMRFFKASEFEDFRGVVALHNEYVTAEPFIEWDWDLRVQKIGNHYRAFKRVSPNWKGNVGNASVIEDVPVEDHWRRWVDEASMVFGGLDICAIDALHSKVDGKEYILELNDTAIGLVHRHEAEDTAQIRDLVLSRMLQHFGLADPIPTDMANDAHSLRQQLAEQQVRIHRAEEHLQVAQRETAFAMERAKASRRESAMYRWVAVAAGFAAIVTVLAPGGLTGFISRLLQ